MKPKHPFHPIHLALLGISILLLSPAAHALAQHRDNDGISVEIADSEEMKRASERARVAAELVREAAEYARETAELAKEFSGTTKTSVVIGNAIRAQQTTERVKETAQLAKETAERAQKAAERAREAPKEAPKEAAEAARTKDKEEEIGNAERAKEAAERAKETAERAKETAERAKETAERTKEAAEKEQPTVEPALEDEKSDAPGNARKPREETKPQDNGGLPVVEETPEIEPDAPAERESAEIPASEPERLAEIEVAEITRDVQRELDQRKTRIEGREEAQALIDDILGAESRISRAELAREERFRTRLERQRPGGERFIEVSPDQRREATTYFQQRLRGREVEGPPPGFFHRSDRRGDRRDPRGDGGFVERVDYIRPRYLNEGRRYVHFDSRAAIPAILMAAQAMNHVRFQPTREIAPIFYERQNVDATHAMPLPPENYRSENSWVVSYPVDENSMISSEDILFLQGSTQFSDPYSYEVVGALADAMKAMPEEERFVIEGHASAEGSYDSNMALSQQRAEHIVREIVRRGVSPYRLLPVGYGESEARNSADAAEALRSQDRRVVVFRMKPELVAER